MASASAGLLKPLRLRGRRVAVGLSGGVDSVVLLHVLHGLAPQLGYRLCAVHVNHGLSANAGDWQRFCSAFALELDVPFRAYKVNVTKRSQGLEAAARQARRAVFAKAGADAIAFAHHLDDQAETVLFNLLRGAGLEGASGMPAVGRLGRSVLLRPLLEVPRSAIHAYAQAHRLTWMEDESNADEALTRNFIRRRVGPLLEPRFPRWRENLGRAARHFARAQLDAQALLRDYLKRKGLRAPSESKLLEMLKQLGSASGSIAHDGVVFRRYRDSLFPEKITAPPKPFKARAWNGESRLALPALGGELRFRRVPGQGIASALLKENAFEIRQRSGGERLRIDAKRPRRTLKNLFQEAGVPPWERERMPLLFCGKDLVWAPGLGVDAKYLSAARASGFVPDWRPYSS
ncbi:MAG: tRNA lysidine(34) synthetase TilS [Candidatus Parcubacteria bacterium]|nr:tRNA lysidine(34) synthetase TilS [Burkholderiales bacterium]